jgi:hypothetical protein
MATGNENGTAPGQRSVLLGLFVLFQLAVLVSHNLFSLLQELNEHIPEEAPATRRIVQQLAPGWLEKKGHLWNVMEGSTQLTHRWSQVTLQLQQWSLFAPNVGTECVFPALLLSDEEPSVTPVAADESGRNYAVRGKLVLSDNEPPDLTRYFRWGAYRLRKYENNLVTYLSPREDETPEQLAERWRERIKDYVHANSDMLQAYVKWRLDVHGESPRQVILLMRRYSLNAPSAEAEFFDGPFTLPVARWQPDAAAGLEYFNPVSRRFESLSQ